MGSEEVQPTKAIETADVGDIKKVDFNKFSLVGKLDSLKQGSFINNLQADQILSEVKAK